MVHLHVLKGPDKGQSQSFASGKITLGYDSDNDFTLADDSVSPFHGVIEITPARSVRYSDLGAGRGSSVVSGDRLFKLHEPDKRTVEFNDRAQILIGSTVLEVSLAANRDRVGGDGPTRKEKTTPPKTRISEGDDDHYQLRDHIVRRVKEAPDRLAQRISRGSDRLQVLFRLTRQLNGLNRFDDILDKVAEATFDMFPLANFFAIVVPDERTGDLRPFFKRQRKSGGSQDPILSHSIVEQVVEKRESILYVRDKVEGDGASKSIVKAEITACLAAPLVAQRKLMGVMQVDSRGQTGLFTYDDLDLFVVLASSLAFAMERARLTRSIYEMFEAFVEASVAAIEARDPTTAGHSERVAYYSLMTAEGVNRQINGPLGPISFSGEELTELRYAALLHDFGKIGVAEQVLQKPSRLHPEVERLILARIESYRYLHRHRLQHELFEALLKESRPPTPKDVERLDAKIKADNDQVNRWRDMILRLQAPQARPRDEDLAIIREMEAVRYLDEQGREQRLLSPDEAKDLGISRGTLNTLERLHIESHAALTEDYLSRIPWSDDLQRIPCIAGAHHEKLDGTGYPKGLHAVDLMPQVRILTIADIFDALTAADRPYRKAMAAERASRILSEEAGSGKLDDALVSFFNRSIVPVLKPQLLSERT